jgi:hypothetical protein
MTIGEGEHAVDQFLTFEVAYLTECDVTAEMIGAVRIAAWAMQWALARDFDGKRWRVASQDSAPRREDALHDFHACTIALEGQRRKPFEP